MPTDTPFRFQYGPRALIAGAAVGLGAEYARQLGGAGTRPGVAGSRRRVTARPRR